MKTAACLALLAYLDAGLRFEWALAAVLALAIRWQWARLERKG